MEFEKDDRVVHLQKPEWGPGVICAKGSEGKLRIHFVEVGEKLLNLKHANLAPFEGSDIRLEHLSSAPVGKPDLYLGPTRAREKFLAAYPGGFSSPEYLEAERKDKDEACQLLQEILGESVMRGLIESEEFEEIGKRALRVAGKTKLIFPAEKKALRDGLEKPEHCERFAHDLCELLYGEGELRVRFSRFSETLHRMRAAKWTVATYFLFICHPQEHMLLKPVFIQKAAAAFRFDLQYKVNLNWTTYERLLELAGLIRRETEELRPADMIDVQSFIWCIAR